MMSAFSFAHVLCILAGIGIEEDLDTAQNFIICQSGASCFKANRGNEATKRLYR